MGSIQQDGGRFTENDQGGGIYHKIGICREAGFEGAPAAMKVVPPACRKAKAHYKGGNDGDEDKDGAN